MVTGQGSICTQPYAMLSLCRPVRLNRPHVLHTGTGPLEPIYYTTYNLRFNFIVDCLRNVGRLTVVGLHGRGGGGVGGVTVQRGPSWFN